MLVLKLLHSTFEQQQLTQLTLITALNTPSQLLTMHRRIPLRDLRPIESIHSFLPLARTANGVLLHQLHQIVLEILLLLIENPLRTDIVLIEKVLPRNTTKLILLQHPSQHQLRHCTDRILLRRNHNTIFIIIVYVQHLLYIAVAIRTVPKQHLEQHYSTRPHISLRPIHIPIHNLRRHVQRRSQ